MAFPGVVQDVPVLPLPVSVLHQDAEVLHYAGGSFVGREDMARKQRLPHGAYEVEGSTWHITVTVDRVRGSPFQDIELGHLVLKYWVNGCRLSEAVPHLVCLMPDHLHMIVEVKSVGLIELVRRLKSNSTAIYRAKTGKGTLWQQSFYDHGLRESRDFESAVEYVLVNPVRAELAERWEDYPLMVGDYLTANHSPE